MSTASSYQQPQSTAEAIGLAEELLVDRYYQPEDLQPLLSALNADQQQYLRQLVNEMRSVPLVDDALVQFYGRKIWRLYNNEMINLQ